MRTGIIRIMNAVVTDEEFDLELSVGSALSVWLHCSGRDICSSLAEDNVIVVEREGIRAVVDLDKSDYSFTEEDGIAIVTFSTGAGVCSFYFED